MAQESAPNPTFPIDRKVWVPQIAMLLTFGIAAFASSRGLNIPAETQVVITGLLTMIVGGVVGWLVPMAKEEVKRRLTDEIVIEAQLDPNVPVSVPAGETIDSLKDKLEVEKLKKGISS